MNLEHCRKEAKALRRAVAEREPRAVARARAVLGERASSRFLLSDAQHVIAVERGYRSWPALRHAAALREDTTTDTGLRYRPGEPVLVRVTRRPGRVTVSDDGRALECAAVTTRWRELADRLARELNVNVSGRGAVWLPVVRAGPGEAEIVRRIAHASLSFYQDLLDLE